MKALKSYVRGLDCKAIPQFLAQVSETKETGSFSGEYTTSLYEVLARVHGGMRFWVLFDFTFSFRGSFHSS
ncbi:hypothetical protein OIU84_028407 [Salix udensis]|uniref:Uncharacterized protein n=1 Tax=Salix udensis TaxID=889485 RepID=A0AAD6KCH1_9ROSI|nr:hypothetical protein OIU84_028407 [Salix udensis]